MRRPKVGLLALSFSAFVIASVIPAPRAWSQAQAAATLQLVSQSHWNAASRPLALAIRATNTSDQPLTGLSVVLSIQAPPRSRSVYELSLRADATSLLSASLFPQRGALEPGQSRTFQVRQGLGELASRQEDAIYPLKVQLLSGDTPVAALRTPMVFLNEPPKVPLNLEWTWVLSAPLRYRPDGTFLSTELEQDVAPGGRLSAVVQTLRRLGDTPLDVAVSPLLVDQLTMMASGYRVLDPGGGTRTVRKGSGGASNAAAVLDALSEVARGRITELMALPFGDAVVPSMIRAGLANEVPAVISRGRAVVKSALGTPPQTTVFRPPFSLIDDPTMTALSRMGVKTVVLDPNAVPQDSELMFSPASVVTLSATAGPMNAVVPDPQVVTVAQQFAGDPTLAAHAALGELAATWLEFPGRAGRGAAVLFPERTALDPKFFRSFGGLVASSPWLAPVRASRFVSVIKDVESRPVTASRYTDLDPTYVSRLFEVQGSLTQFGVAAEGAGPLIQRLEDRLLLAGTTALHGDPVLARQFVDSVEETIRGTYAGIKVSQGVVTLTSREGFIPVTLRNSSGVPLRVQVKLLADLSVAFLTGNSRRILLPTNERTLTFAVRAKTTGRFPIRVQVRTPGPGPSAETITQSEVVVRSTAYNRLALFLTIGAGLFLLVWWGRRFLPRPRS